MTTVRGRRLPDESPGARATAVEDLLADATGLDDEVLVLVDGPYPYHASTGYVTDPRTLRAVLGALGDRDVVVATAGGDGIDPLRTARFLGYERVAAEGGASLRSLADADAVEVTVTVDGSPEVFAVPEPIHERSVVVVPTVRRTPEWGVEAGCWTLASALGDVTVERLRAAPAACDPATTLVDAVHVYGDPPARPRLLLAGDDAVATTAAVASLFDAGDVVPHVDNGTLRSLALEGFDRDAVGALLAGTAPRSGGEGGGAAAGYRLYARLTGDLVPPQLLGGGG